MTIALGVLSLLGVVVCVALTGVGQHLVDDAVDSIFKKRANLFRLGFWWLITVAMIVLAITVTFTSDEAGEIWAVWIIVGLCLFVGLLQGLGMLKARPPRAHDPARTRPD